MTIGTLNGKAGCPLGVIETSIRGTELVEKDWRVDGDIWTDMVKGSINSSIQASSDSREMGHIQITTIHELNCHVLPVGGRIFVSLPRNVTGLTSLVGVPRRYSREYLSVGDHREGSSDEKGYEGRNHYCSSLNILSGYGKERQGK